MSEGVNSNLNIKANFDGTSLVAGMQQTGQVSSSIAAGIQQDFKKMASSVDEATAMMVTEINAIDRELNRLGRAVNRGIGPEQVDSINALQSRLAILRDALKANAPDNFMSSVSQEATIARTNLHHVEQMMNRIQSMSKQTASQQGIANVYGLASNAGEMSPTDPRYLAALRGDQRAIPPTILSGGPRADDAILMAQQTQKQMLEERKFYANLEKQEEQRKRREDREWRNYVNEERRKETQQEKEDRKELRRLEKALDPRNERSDPLEDVRRAIERTSTPAGEHPALQMVREAAAKDEATRVRVERARQLDAFFDNHYFQQRQSNLQAESEWIHSNRPQVTPLVQLDTSNSLDLRYQHQLREEQFQRDKAHQTEMFHREAQHREQIARNSMGDRQGPAPIAPVYGPFPQNLNERQYGIGSRGNWIGGRDNRQFIGQQLAYGADDMIQQYMWSSSPAAGISAAARAGGNNLTAAISATNMNPLPMMGAMIGLQGVAMAISMYARYRDEVEKARVSTTNLERAMDDIQRTASREVRFKYSLEDKDSKALKADEREAEIAKEELESGKYRASADRLTKIREEREALLEEQQQIRERVREASKAVGQGGVPYIAAEDTERDTYISDRLDILNAEEKALTPDAEKYYEETARLDEESARRKVEIEKKVAKEEQASKRETEGKKRTEMFLADLEAEQRQSGITLSGDEYAARIDQFIQDNPHLNLNELMRSKDTRVNEQTNRYNDKVFEQSEDVQRRNQDYQIERKYRDDIYGDIRAEFEKEMSRIGRDYKMLSSEERGILEENARDKMDYDISRKSEEYDKNLRSGYKALSGITSGSEEEAQLRAKLTVDSGMKTEAEKQTKVLEEIAKNTKPKKTPQPQVVRLS